MEKTILYMHTMSNSSTSNSSSNINSTDDTESTHIECDAISPPIRNSFTVENLMNFRRWPVKSFATKPSVSHAKLHTPKPFRKCKSFIHLTKNSSDRVHSALIDHRSMANSDHLFNKSSSTPSIYTAIKPEHRFLVHRIFNRCKVVMFRCCYVRLLFSIAFCYWPLLVCSEKTEPEMKNRMNGNIVSDRKKWQTKSIHLICIYSFRLCSHDGFKRIIMGTRK